MPPPPPPPPPPPYSNPQSKRTSRTNSRSTPGKSFLGSAASLSHASSSSLSSRPSPSVTPTTTTTTRTTTPVVTPESFLFRDLLSTPTSSVNTAAEEEEEEERQPRPRPPMSRQAEEEAEGAAPLVVVGKDDITRSARPGEGLPEHPHQAWRPPAHAHSPPYLPLRPNDSFRQGCSPPPPPLPIGADEQPQTMGGVLPSVRFPTTTPMEAQPPASPSASSSSSASWTHLPHHHHHINVPPPPPHQQYHLGGTPAPVIRSEVEASPHVCEPPRYTDPVTDALGVGGTHPTTAVGPPHPTTMTTAHASSEKHDNTNTNNNNKKKKNNNNANNATEKKNPRYLKLKLFHLSKAVWEELVRHVEFLRLMSRSQLMAVVESILMHVFRCEDMTLTISPHLLLPPSSGSPSTAPNATGVNQHFPPPPQHYPHHHHHHHHMPPHHYHHIHINKGSRGGGATAPLQNECPERREREPNETTVTATSMIRHGRGGGEGGRGENTPLNTSNKGRKRRHERRKIMAFDCGDGSWDFNGYRYTCLRLITAMEAHQGVDFRFIRVKSLHCLYRWWYHHVLTAMPSTTKSISSSSISVWSDE